MITVDDYYYIGTRCLNIGELDDAIKYLSRCLTITTNIPEIYYNLGVAYFDKQDYKQAMDCFKQSIKLKPEYDLAYFNFMSREGVVIDLCSNAPVNPFLFEAEKADLRTLARKEIVSQFEFSTLLKLGLLTTFEKENFFQEYSEIMTID